VVGNKKETFLQECTVKVSDNGALNVFCRDVISGSIKVILGGSKKDVKTAVEAVTSSGGSVPFDLPSFSPLIDADLDECASPTDNDCDAQATCANTPDGHLCTCKEGFVGTGVTCTEAPLKAASTTNTPTNTPTTDSTDDTKSEAASTPDSTGTIVGVSVGVTIVVLIIVAVVVVIFVLRGNKKKNAVTPRVAAPDVIKSVAAPEKFKPSFMAEEPKSKPVEQAEPESEPETEPLIVPITTDVQPFEPVAPTSQSQYVSTRGDENFTLGQRVIAHGYQAGVIMYIGELQSMPSMRGVTYIGVKLDRPEGSGDGTVNGIRYFDCDPFCSVFVTPHAVKAEN